MRRITKGITTALVVFILLFGFAIKAQAQTLLDLGCFALGIGCIHDERGTCIQPVGRIEIIGDLVAGNEVHLEVHDFFLGENFDGTTGGNFLLVLDPIYTEAPLQPNNVALSGAQEGGLWLINLEGSAGDYVSGSFTITLPEDLEPGTHILQIFQDSATGTEGDYLNYWKCSYPSGFEVEGEPPVDDDTCWGDGPDEWCVCGGDSSTTAQPLCDDLYCSTEIIPGHPTLCSIKKYGVQNNRCRPGSNPCDYGEATGDGEACRCIQAPAKYTGACYAAGGKAGIDTAIGCIPFNSYQSMATFFLAWGMGVGGGVAFLLIIFASFQVMTSGGDPKKLQGGKELLTSAIIGLLMVIFAAFLLRTIGVNILGIF